MPEQLPGRDNVAVDRHGRPLCFDYQLGKCNKAADGAECPNGWHLCVQYGMLLILRRITTSGNQDSLDNLASPQLGRGATWGDVVIEIIFCGPSHATTWCNKFVWWSQGVCTRFLRRKRSSPRMRSLQPDSVTTSGRKTAAFGSARSVSHVAVCDLWTNAGLELLWQWLQLPNLNGFQPLT